MSRTLIGITSFGGLPFLELAIRSIQETTTQADFLVIVADPKDQEMMRFCADRGFRYRFHHENLGFPASVNDCYDAAFVQGDYDYLIIMGNDVVAMPGAIDAMIRTADETEYEMVCGSEFNSRFLVTNYPEARPYFEGQNLAFSDFSSRPWELHTERRSGIEPHARKDIRNFTLFKRSAFEKVGYADVNYWPNGYWEDNQYCDRCDHLGVSACGLLGAPFFHFWSRTIHQNVDRPHGVYFERNREYHEKWQKNPVWYIGSRDEEPWLIRHWRSK